MENQLIPIESVNAVELFTTEGSLDKLLSMIEEEATSFVPDISTDEGRKEIASRAYAVARSKTVIDGAGKDLVADEKVRLKKIDERRKHARDFCDALKVRVREPLTMYEEELAAQAKAAADLAEMQADEIEAYGMNDLFDREAKALAKEAELEAKEAELRRKEREDQIAREAADRALREKAEQDERERIKREQEQERIAREEADRLAEEKRLKSRREHVGKIHREALSALMSYRMTEEQGKRFITLVAKGMIPHIKMEY